MQFELYTDVNADVTANVENIVKDVTGAAPSSVIKAGDSGTQVVIKTLELDSETRDQVFQAVAEAYNLPEGDQPIKSDYVSASVGADLRNSAIIASAVAAVLILLYITIRFEFRSGIAAVIALVHDLLVMLSMYIIFQIPFNMNFIAAALTILGYSINATIVVFDRIRENRKLMPKEEFASVVDHSIWQTMNRSINTTVTTLLAIVLLLFWASALFATSRCRSPLAFWLAATPLSVCPALSGTSSEVKATSSTHKREPASMEAGTQGNLCPGFFILFALGPWGISGQPRS